MRFDVRFRQIRRARGRVDFPDCAEYFVYQRDSYAERFADRDSDVFRDFVSGIFGTRKIRAAFFVEITLEKKL